MFTLWNQKSRNVGTSCIRRRSRKKCDRCIYLAYRIWVTQGQMPFNETNKKHPQNSWSPHFRITLWNQKSRNAGTSCTKRQSRKKCDHCIYSAHRIFCIFSLKNHWMARNSWNWGLKQNHEIAGTANCDITKCGDPLYKTAKQEEMWPLHLLGSPDLSYSSTNTVQWNQRSLLSQFFSSQKKKIGSCKSVRKQFQNKKAAVFLQLREY